MTKGSGLERQLSRRGELCGHANGKSRFLIGDLCRLFSHSVCVGKQACLYLGQRLNQPVVYA